MSSQPSIKLYTEEAIELLSTLIRIPSPSGEESKTADAIETFLTCLGIKSQRKKNNVWIRNQFFDIEKETILLNSHHDTVKANEGYLNDPFDPIIGQRKLYGLGSNDAGGCLVSMAQVFRHFCDREDLPYNLIFSATAEEENSGVNGISLILEELGPIHLAIVGEPTEMKMAVAEKGLMVLDCRARGTSGHAARGKGVNAIYEAMSDIEWFRNYRFKKESEFLGPIKMTATMIKSGYQHNVVPDICDFVVDVRTTDAYSNVETLAMIKSHVKSEVVPRSTRLEPSSIPLGMPILQVADQLGIEKFGSPTTSDQALINFPSVKIGPGSSERSHTADEFIYLEEIKKGIQGYIELLDKLFETKLNQNEAMAKRRTNQ